MDKKKLGWIVFSFILLGFSFGSIWLTDLTTEQLVFNLHVSLKGANNNAVWACLLFACTCSAAVVTVFATLLHWLRVNQPDHKLLVWTEQAMGHKRITAAVAIVLCLLCVNYNLEFTQFVRHQMEVTTVYQDEYVDPATVTYEFPEKKRNLVYIFLDMSFYCY